MREKLYIDSEIFFIELNYSFSNLRLYILKLLADYYKSIRKGIVHAPRWAPQWQKLLYWSANEIFSEYLHQLYNKVSLIGFCQCFGACGKEQIRSLWAFISHSYFLSSITNVYRIWKTMNSLSTNPTKWSNTLKQFSGFWRRIVLVCLTILWDWRSKG